MYRALQIFVLLGVHLCLSAGVNGFGVAKRPDEGQNLRLRWKSGSIQVAISTSLTAETYNIRPNSDVAGAIRRSLATWEAVGAIQFEQVSSDKQSVSPAGNAGDGVSLITIAQTPENLLMFSKDAGDVSARTRVFYNRRGFITEADIVLNPYQQFSTEGAIGTFDLESTLTHEIGHLLGLEHSAVFGATMHDNYGKNGLFSLQSFSARSLGEDDIASVRALYGSGTDTECCGRIAGRLTTKARNLRLWAEEPETGRVFAEIAPGADGTFRLEGLPAGVYELYAQGSRTGKNIVSTEMLERVTVEKGRTVNVTRKLTERPGTFDLNYVGFNGQLSELAVSVNRGKTYTVYVGGKNLDPMRLNVGLSSKFLGITPGTIVAHEYDEGLTVMSFELIVRPGTPLGEYSISLESASGEKHTIIGALTVEEFANPWNTSVVSED